jgi:hypothetical protein
VWLSNRSIHSMIFLCSFRDVRLLRNCKQVIKSFLTNQMRQ